MRFRPKEEEEEERDELNFQHLNAFTKPKLHIAAPLLLLQLLFVLFTKYANTHIHTRTYAQIFFILSFLFKYFFFSYFNFFIQIYFIFLF